MKHYVPIRPVGENFLYDASGELIVYEQEGLYQPGPPEEVARRRAAIKPFLDGELSGDDLQVQIYQEWAELDWRAPHGSYAAVGRFGSKIIEEAGTELVGAHQNQKEVQEFFDEAGDALWTTMAVASSGGVDSTQAIREYLRDWYLHPDPAGPVTFGELSYKLRDHYPTIFIDPLFLPKEISEPDEFTPDLSLYMAWFSRAAAGAIDRQHGYGEKADKAALANMIEHISGAMLSGAGARIVAKIAHMIEHESEHGFGGNEVVNYVMESYFQKIKREITSPLIGRGIVFLEYAVRTRGFSLGQIAVNNIRKVSRRVATNTIDKSDGDRPDELK